MLLFLFLFPFSDTTHSVFFNLGEEEKETEEGMEDQGNLTHVPLLPVMTGTRRGLLRMLNMIGLWTQGMRKWVPSPDTVCNTPLKRSKITALSPPSTVGRKVGNRTSIKYQCHA